MTNTTGSAQKIIQKHASETKSDRCGPKRQFCLPENEIFIFENNHQIIRSCNQPENSPIFDPQSE